jgi:hypothetical protein
MAPSFLRLELVYEREEDDGFGFIQTKEDLLPTESLRSCQEHGGIILRRFSMGTLRMEVGRV